MNASDLAGMLELLAAGLRALPAGAVPAAATQALAAAAPQIMPARTLADWLVEHERELGQRGHKAQTMRNRRALIAHCRRLWGDRAITALRAPEIVQGLRTFPAKNSATAQRVLLEQRDVYAEAIAAGWAEVNPAASLKLPKHKVKRKRLKLEVWESMLTLAKAGPQRWVTSMLLLALVTGQRRADLAKMRFDDVVAGEDGQKYLRVEQQKEAGKGYGARVEIPLALRLDAIGMTVGEVIEHCRATAKPGPTMLRKAGGGPIEVSSLSARFHQLVVAVLGENACDDREWPSLHEVRSLAGRVYVKQGIDVQTLLGHTDAEMTAIYLDERDIGGKAWKRVGAAPVAA